MLESFVYTMCRTKCRLGVQHCTVHQKRVEDILLLQSWNTGNHETENFIYCSRFKEMNVALCVRYSLAPWFCLHITFSEKRPVPFQCNVELETNCN